MQQYCTPQSWHLPSGRAYSDDKVPSTKGGEIHYEDFLCPQISSQSSSFWSNWKSSSGRYKMKFFAGLALLSLAAAMPASKISEEIRISISVDAHEHPHVPATKVEQVIMASEKPPPCDKSCPEDVSHLRCRDWIYY